MQRILARTRPTVVALAFLTLILSSLIAARPTLAVDSVLLSVPNRTDVCYDTQRSLLYISAGDEVLRYDVNAGEYLEPFVLGGQLAGMDISPDGSTLAVADTTYVGAAWHWPPDPNPDNTSRIHLVDLDTGDVDVRQLWRDYGETGTWMVAWDANGLLLVTSQLSGSGWTPLRRYDPDTGGFTELTSVRQNAALSASGDRQKIAFIEPNISSGDWGVYDAASGTITGGPGTSFFNYEVAANRNGTLFGVPCGTFRVFNGALAQLRDAGPSSGGKFSPSEDILYTPQPGSGIINAYDTNTWELLGTYDAECSFGAYTIGWTGAGTFAWPRMSIADNDKFIAVTVPGGVRYFDSRIEVSGHVRSSAGGGPVPTAMVEIWRENGEGDWELETAVPASESGAWGYSTTDPSPVRLRAYDPSSGHRSRWYGGSDLNSAESVSPTSGVSADFTLPFAFGAALGGYVMDETHGRPISGVQVTATNNDSEATPLRTTTTADGIYHFGNVPPGHYTIEFEDPGLKWDTQYSYLADTLGDAEPVSVTGPGAFYASAILGRHTSVLALTPAAASAASTLTAVAGGTVTLETTCTDVDFDNLPRNGMAVKLQSSLDDTTWTTLTIPVTNPSPGVYRASITSSAIQSMYYRFVVPDGDYVQGTTSMSCYVSFRGPTYWNGSASVVDGYSPAPEVGAQTAVRCQLLKPNDTAATGRQVVLQASADGGSSWWTSLLVVYGDGLGTYTAYFHPLKPMMYRFATVGTAAEPSAVSGPVSLGSVGVIGGAWSSWGGGVSYTAHSSVEYGKQSRVAAKSTTHTGANVAVECYESLDAVDYRPARLPVIRGAALEKDGQVAVSYTVQTRPVLTLRFFALVMPATGGPAPVAPQVAGLISIAPSPVFTVNAPKKARAGRTFAVSGLVKPRLTGGAKVLQVLVRRSGAKSARNYCTVAVTPRSGDQSGYSARLKLARGTYYIQGRILAGGAWPGGLGSVYRWGASQHSPTRKVVVR
jgi:5-hydroxyisourate hydrolase-like protein (transthyretin family)